MKSRMIRVALAAALVLAAALPAALQAAETRGVVQRVDVATNTVYFTDGRTVRIDPSSRLTVDGRSVSLAEVQPGWTLVIPSAAATAPAGTVVVAPAPPAPASPPRAPVDATGVVSRVDPQTGTIVLEDGRVLQATGRTSVWQSVPLADVKPGASVFVRGADPLDYRPSAAPPVGTARFDEGDRKLDADKKQHRTIGQIIDDATIVAEVTAKLTADKLSNFTKINVKSDAGTVTLSGTVDSAERRARAAQIAAGVNGVKTVLNNIEVSGGSTASTPPPPASATTPAAAPVEVTGTVASVDAGSGTITLQDGRMLKATDQTIVWQPASLASLKPGSQVLVRGAAASDYRTGAAAGTRNWRMATVSRVDRSAGELRLSDGSTVKVTSATNVHRGADRVGLESLEPGSEVVVYTPSATTTEASEVAVVWTPTASVR
jgi:hypothetical protein